MEHEVAPKLDILSPDLIMVLLTWVTFFILLFVLKKFAWKPILEGLKQREDHIRQSLEDADKAKAQLVQVESSKAQILNDAKTQAAQIIDDARKVARDLAHDIEQKAKAGAEDILQNAHSQIEGERQHVRQALKKESADIAIALASKILKEDSNSEKNRRLVDAAIKEL